MNAGGRAIPAALTQQHMVMFIPQSPDLICPTCLVAILHKIYLDVGTVFTPVSSRFQIAEENLKIVKKSFNIIAIECHGSDKTCRLRLSQT